MLSRSAIFAGVVLAAASCSMRNGPPPDATTSRSVPPAQAAQALLPGLTTPSHTELVLVGSRLPAPAGLPSWSTGGDVPAGSVATIGDIELCTVGPPGSVQIVSVGAQGARHSLRVVSFSTRDPGSQLLEFDLESLSDSGFPATGADVGPCHGSYQEALIGAPGSASAELGVEFEKTGSAQEEDRGLIVTYRGPDGALRTISVPIDVIFCTEPAVC